MRVLVTGARGLLGAAIVREFSRAADVIPLDRSTLDIADEAAVAAAVDARRPDAIVNCAAYNDVDGAESDPVSAFRVNAFGVLGLSRAARAAGSALVHYSSDFVFDGESDRPYHEEDRPNPRGAYATSKLLGDLFALECPRAYVLRVESLFGDPGPAGARRGSLGIIVGRLRSGEEVPVFTDRTVSPSYTPDVARATRMLLAAQAPPGVYHCVNSGAATWVEVAAEAAALMGVRLKMKPLTLETAGLKAPRPRYCALSNAKLQGIGVPMPEWRDALRRYLSGSGAPAR